jgi:hypothetical protein
LAAADNYSAAVQDMEKAVEMNAGGSGYHPNTALSHKKE